MKKFRIILVLACLGLAGTLPAEETLININTASSEELQTLDGIGPVKAQAIIDYRDEHGPFENIEDIKDVRGIGKGIFSNIKDYITVSDPEPSLPTVTISGVISSSTTWSSEEGIYILENVVTVSASTTLTILPGTIIKGKSGGAGALVIEGTLAAVGTNDERIYFTSLSDDEDEEDSDEDSDEDEEDEDDEEDSEEDEEDGDGDSSAAGGPGDWRGIRFTPGSVGNLEYVEVRNAGYVGVGSQSGIENEGGTLEISNSTITDNNLRGIYSRVGGSVVIEDSIVENHQYGITATAGELSIRNSVIRNNSAAGLDAYGAESLTLIDNAFYGNQKMAKVDISSEFTHSGNTSDDLASRGFEISGTVTRDVVLNASDLPFIIPADSMLWVDAGRILTVSPGSILKFGSSGQMIVEGNLVSEGTDDQQIHLTSLKDDSVGGDTNGDGVTSTSNNMDWNGVQFWAGSNGKISHTALKYAGKFNGTAQAAILNKGGDILLKNTTFSHNSHNDIYQTVGSSTISHTIFSDNTLQALVNTGTSTMDARFNWWKTDTGPTHASNASGTGPIISGNILFDPWLRRDPALPNPVIIVPGILSSQLINSVNSEVWPASILLLSPLDLHLNQLELLSDGVTFSSEIQVGNLIESLGDFDFFLSLINLLESGEYQDDTDLFLFPYDWRLNIQTSATDLKQRIAEIKAQTGAEKVDLIAHSMGGLLVKKYLEDYSVGSVDKFIDIGTPHTGSPKAFKILNYGDNLDATFFFDLLGLNSERIKIISQNMPSIYQLLPSQKYFEDSNPDYKYYVFNGINGNDRLTFAQTSDYLKAKGRNGALVDRAEAFHQEVDDLDPATYGVDSYNIVGCGTPTIGQFYILEDGEHPIYNIRMINGDGTVPLKSAEAMTALETYYVKNAQHAVMPSTSGVKELVASILTGDDFNISSYSNLATDSTDCRIPNGKLVSFHSPIELHVYDSSGNHTGPDANGDIENEIDGVVYEVIDDNKFAFLPEGTTYNIKGSATDAGTFDTRIQEIVDGEVVTTSIFADVPLTLNTQVNFDLGPSVPSQIYLDHDGNEVFESEQAVSTTTAGILESTGKITKVVQVAEPVRSSSRPIATSTVETAVLGVATSSEVLLPPVEPVEKLVIQVELPQIIEKPEEEISEEPKYESTAVVYKSFSHKVKSMFIAMWGWIKSRL